jgi:hypothetical protein
MEYTVKVDKEGTVRYYKPGTNIFHRKDGPAILWRDGTQKWYIDGKLHREDGPASINPDVLQRWYQKGKL